MRASFVSSTWLVLGLAACGTPEADRPITAPVQEEPAVCTDTGDGCNLDLTALRRPHMWFTCGDPVCRGHTPHPGLPSCSPAIEGRLCPVAGIGRMCDPGDGCNRLLECRRDPNTGPCPISKAEFKHDISYLTPTTAKRLHQELMDFKLATWQYNWDDVGTPQHLGFIIDDVPTSAAVAADGGHVNLYGYTTMAVASLQEQQRQLTSQAAEIAALKAELAELKAALKR